MSCYPKRLANSVSRALLVAAAVALAGCQAKEPAPAADEHQHAAPTTLAEAHHQLEELGGEIEAAFKADEPEKAHGALHAISKVIVALPGLAKKAGVEAESDVEQVKNDLMDNYSKLDDVLHKRGDATWGDVEGGVDAAMEKLEGWLPDGATRSRQDQ